MADVPATATPPKQRRFGLSLLGLLLTLAGVPLWMALTDNSYIRRTAIVVWPCMIAGTLLAIWAASKDGRRRVRVVALLNVMAAGLFVYAFFFMAAMPEARAFESLKTAPDFTVADHTGKQVSLAEMRRGGPVLLVFYRGFW
jgi:peptidoglycan/LPS O-acetylase OafA/YrhL